MSAIEQQLEGLFTTQSGHPAVKIDSRRAAGGWRCRGRHTNAAISFPHACAERQFLARPSRQWRSGGQDRLQRDQPAHEIPWVDLLSISVSRLRLSCFARFPPLSWGGRRVFTGFRSLIRVKISPVRYCRRGPTPGLMDGIEVGQSSNPCTPLAITTIAGGSIEVEQGERT